VNTVFHQYALFPFMTASENVAFGLRYQKVGRAETARRVGQALGPASVTHRPGSTVQCVCTPDAVRVLRRSPAAAPQDPAVGDAAAP
jgi:ABC-type nitrate/sulfonate/bicarbonate transport system ATPase subunit